MEDEIKEVKEPKKSEEPKKHVEPKKAKMVSVRLVANVGPSALVEWEDKEGFHRVTIPRVEIKDGKADALTLDAGIPYGFDWSLVELKPLDMVELKYELNKRDIWTADDIRSKPAQVTTTTTKLLGLMRHELLAAAKAAEKEA